MPDSMRTTGPGNRRVQIWLRDAVYDRIASAGHASISQYCAGVITDHVMRSREAVAVDAAEQGVGV